VTIQDEGRQDQPGGDRSMIDARTVPAAPELNNRFCVSFLQATTGREFSCCAFTAISKKVRQKVHASKPEAQAEGNRVI
jgi:hypothetical protein